MNGISNKNDLWIWECVRRAREWAWVFIFRAVHARIEGQGFRLLNFSVLRYSMNRAFLAWRTTRFSFVKIKYFLYFSTSRSKWNRTNKKKKTSTMNGKWSAACVVNLFYPFTVSLMFRARTHSTFINFAGHNQKVCSSWKSLRICLATFLPTVLTT